MSKAYDSSQRPKITHPGLEPGFPFLGLDTASVLLSPN